MYSEPRGSEVRVVLVGVGAIGCEIGRLLLRKKGVRIVGAVDPAPNKAGRDLGDVIGLGEKLGITVLEDIGKLSVEADIAVHATTSALSKAYPQIVELVKRGLNVISTCEELSYPFVVSEELSRNIDDLAKEHGVTVLGTGINPGFLMDTLVISLTAVCQDVRRICVERVMDAAKRRLSFQVKIGAGLSVEEFREKISRGYITGHVGLKQSIAMISDAIGLRLERIEEEPIAPIVAESEAKSAFITVKPGSVAGLLQRAHGIVNGEPAITLSFKAYIGAGEEYDSIIIDGVPPVHEKISPCVHGDLGTAAVIVNMLPRVINAPPGLKTMKDLQVPSA
ncbi:MAG: NADP-binding protein, partial [Candidatus Bathyarchaeia archaeon]